MCGLFFAFLAVNINFDSFPYKENNINKFPIHMILKPGISKYVVIFSVILIVSFRFIDLPENIITWDVFGYYLYLPAKFIYNDLAISNKVWLDQLMLDYEPSATLYQLVYADNGNAVIKYTLGLSILYSPFFLVAHLFSAPLGFPADGLSLPYQYAMIICGLFWAILGLIWFRKVLRAFFSDKLSALLIVLIVLGTNYFQLTTFDGTLLSHNFLFALYALLIWNTILWHRKQQLKNALIIGISCGFIILIRPSEIICILIPLIWNIYNKESLVLKINILRKHILQIVVIVGMMILIISFQAIYWKLITGKFLFYSYTNPGEGFEFLSPYTLKFLFSFRKGWLIYTPIMIFALAGFYLLYKHKRETSWPLLIFLILNIWIISSWSCWWYAGGSFSSRSLVPAYVILAIPLGYFLKSLNSNRIIKAVIVILLVFFTSLNLFQTWQFENGIISKERMTAAYYFKIFGKTSVSEDDRELLLVERSTSAEENFTKHERYIKRNLQYFDFEDHDHLNQLTHNGNGALLMNEQTPYSPGIELTFSELTGKDHAWIQASVYVYIPDSISGPLPALVATFHHQGKTYKYRAKSFDQERLNYNTWNRLTIDYLTPEVRSLKDNLKVYVWYRGGSEIVIDDFQVGVFEPK